MTTTSPEPRLRIVSFGYGHQAPPLADIVIDVRERFRDPHVSAELRRLTGLDDEVRQHVAQTPGVEGLIDALIPVAAILGCVGDAPVTVAFGCVGGRHRSVAMARMLAERAVTVEHRDVCRPLLAR